MTNTKKHYQAPESDLLHMACESLLCESPSGTTGGTEDYELIDGFTW